MHKHNLGIGDAETLADWFLYHMPQDQRGRLMAELPQVYGRVFPDVDADVIVSRVRAALNRRES